jgi:lipoyl(octanoyl) transferase
VDKNKIAAVGLSSARWITTHGFALNIDPNLEMFDTSIIIPCGIEGRGVTSIAKVLGRDPPPINEVADVVLDKISEVFEVHLQPGQDLK